jgi:hypothetical protein
VEAVEIPFETIGGGFVGVNVDMPLVGAGTVTANVIAYQSVCSALGKVHLY